VDNVFQPVTGNHRGQLGVRYALVHGLRGRNEPMLIQRHLAQPL
jgi:hypothetical protein